MDSDTPRPGAERNSLDGAITVWKISAPWEEKESVVIFVRPRASPRYHMTAVPALRQKVI